MIDLANDFQLHSNCFALFELNIVIIVCLAMCPADFRLFRLILGVFQLYIWWRMGVTAAKNYRNTRHARVFFIEASTELTNMYHNTDKRAIDRITTIVSTEHRILAYK